MLGAPAAAALPLAGTALAPAAAQAQSAPASEFPKLAVSHPDAVGDPKPRLLTDLQKATLARLCALIVPPLDNRPGAVEAETPEFLDHLLRHSTAARQKLYRDGLDRLERDARAKSGKAFSQVDAAQAADLLAPLRQAWTYQEPTDPFARFLRLAKEEILAATVNSRQFAQAASAGRRGATGLNTYWHVID